MSDRKYTWNSEQAEETLERFKADIPVLLKDVRVRASVCMNTETGVYVPYTYLTSDEPEKAYALPKRFVYILRTGEGVFHILFDSMIILDGGVGYPWWPNEVYQADLDAILQYIWAKWFELNPEALPY